jgi:predicted membrane-bound spermidine synthase
MEAVQDESLKEQMVKVRESMDEEMLKAGAGIWNGVWYGMVVSTWIWGFVLFDTMASVEGTNKGLCVLIGMVVSPFLIRVILRLAARWNTKFAMQSTALQDNNNATLKTTINPVFIEDRHIEMVNSNWAEKRVFGKKRCILHWHDFL